MCMEAIILAAGEGTRLRPLTSTRPKPMLPVAGKPILEWDLEALRDSKIKKASIIVGYKKEAITEYFGDNFNGMKIEYVEQKEQLGTGHAVSMAEKNTGENFLVMNGDLIVSKNLISNFIKDHTRSDSDTSICVVEVKNPSEFGIVEVDGSIVRSIVEKPRDPKSNLANAGIYIFNSKIFDAIKRIEKSARLEYELTDAIKIMLSGDRVCAFQCSEQWIDIGRPWDLLDANEIIMKNINSIFQRKIEAPKFSEFRIKLDASKNSEIEKFAVLKGDVHIGENTIVKSGSYIEGPSYIGKNCRIGPNCYIRPYSCILDNVHIGNAVEVKNSIVMSGTNIGHLSYVGDSIIGENCNFGAGTNVANLRVDNDEVKIEIKNKPIKSGRRKFGCIMGDNVKTGINVSIMPGRAIYPNACVEAGSVVRNTIYNE